MLSHNDRFYELLGFPVGETVRLSDNAARDSVAGGGPT